MVFCTLTCLALLCVPMTLSLDICSRLPLCIVLYMFYLMSASAPLSTVSPSFCLILTSCLKPIFAGLSGCAGNVFPYDRPVGRVDVLPSGLVALPSRSPEQGTGDCQDWLPDGASSRVEQPVSLPGRTRFSETPSATQ